MQIGQDGRFQAFYFTDPTGHNWWNDFWDDVEEFFEDAVEDVGNFLEDVWEEVKAPLIAAAAAVASIVLMAIPGGQPLAVLMLQSTWVAAMSAAAAVVTLDTGEGRQLIRRVGNEFFDDVLGMRPATAYIWSSITMHTAVTLAYEMAFANLVADPAAGKRAYDPTRDKVSSKGLDPYDAGRVPPEGFNPSQITALTDKSDNAIALIGSRPTRTGFFTHYAAAAENFPINGVIPVADKTWGILAVCHQITNRTLLDAGISNTVLGQSWDTYLSTVLYGNYGGGTAVKATVGIMAGDDYEN